MGQASVRFPDPRGRRLADVIAGLERGAVIDIAPGRYFERLVLDRSITLRGAGDLTRIGGLGRGSIIAIDAEDAEVSLDSLSLEGGGGPAGGGICLSRGSLNLENVRIHRARADVGGGIAVLGGRLVARLLRIEEVEAHLGGAIYIAGRGRLEVAEAEIRSARADRGGTLYMAGEARASLSALTVSKSRAREENGGQVVWLDGPDPVLSLERVRFADPALGRPLVTAPDAPGLVQVTGSDLSKLFLDERGVLDLGNNRWR